MTAPSEILASIPNCSRERRDRRVVVVGVDRDPVGADAALSVSGVSSATISPWSMIAIRSHHSASSM